MNEDVFSSPVAHMTRSRRKKSSPPSTRPNHSTNTGSIPEDFPGSIGREGDGSLPPFSSEPSAELVEMKKKFKEEFAKLFQEPTDEISFDTFPYFLR